MADSNPEYQKLRGRGYTRKFFKGGAAWRLWLGKDHLLSVKSTGYSEEYRRFYFRDIQAIIISQTQTQGIFNVVFGLPAAICVILVLTQGAGWNVFFGTLFMIFAGLLAYNLWRGPTVKCTIRTAVQTEDLPSLSRLPVAEEVVQRIKPLIEQAQGRLDEQQTPQIVDQVSQVVAPVSAMARKADEELITYHGRAHETLFYLLILCALINGLDLAIHAEPLVVFELIAIFGVMFTGFMAAIKQHRSNMTIELKRVTWISFTGVAVLLYGVFMGANISHSARHPGVMGGPSLGDYGKFMGNWVVNLIMVVYCTPLGALGIYRLYEFRTNLHKILQTQAAAKAEADAQAQARLNAQIAEKLTTAVPIPPVAPLPEELMTTDSVRPVEVAPEPPPPASPSAENSTESSAT